MSGGATNEPKAKNRMLKRQDIRQVRESVYSDYDQLRDEIRNSHLGSAHLADDKHLSSLSAVRFPIDKWKRGDKMPTVLRVDRDPRARSVEFTEDALVVHLDDGRSLSVPLEWFPSLRDAPEDKRNDWRLIGSGVGIHWEELDEDISIQGLLNPARPH